MRSQESFGQIPDEVADCAQVPSTRPSSKHRSDPEKTETASADIAQATLREKLQPDLAFLKLL